MAQECNGDIKTPSQTQKNLIKKRKKARSIYHLSLQFRSTKPKGAQGMSYESVSRRSPESPPNATGGSTSESSSSI